MEKTGENKRYKIIFDVSTKAYIEDAPHAIAALEMAEQEADKDLGYIPDVYLLKQIPKTGENQ